MDWATVIVSETKALAWPIVVLTAVLTLRRQISTVITGLGSRLTTAKGGGIELSFGAKIDEIQSTLPTAELAQLSAEDTAKRKNQIDDISMLPPAYIVSQAWLRAEDAIGRAVKMQPIPPNELTMLQGPGFLRVAQKVGLVSKDEFETLNQLRVLRNQAAHFLTPGISLTDALRYDDIANSIIAQIKLRTTNGDRAP